MVISNPSLAVFPDSDSVLSRHSCRTGEPDKAGS